MKSVSGLLLMFACAVFHSASVCSAQDSSSSNAQEMPPIRDKWAVVIGIDKFSDNRIPPLKYSVKDAKDFAKFLVEKENFASDHVKLLLNEEANSDHILDTIGDNWLPRRVLPEDLVLIYASTHGSPKEVDVAGENFLVASDTRVDKLFSSAIKLEDLAVSIRRRTGCNRIILILDACNSGAASPTGGKGMLRVRNFDIESIVGEGVIVLSSSSADQRSWESMRYPNGVFTHRLMEALQAKGPSTSIADAYKILCDSVEQEVKYDRKTFQTPVLKSKWKGPELVLAVVPARPRKVEDPPPSIEDVPPVDTNKTSAQPAAATVSKTNLQATVARSSMPNRVAIVPPTPPKSYDLTKSSDYKMNFTDKDRETIKHLPEWIHAKLWETLHSKLGSRMVDINEAANGWRGFSLPGDSSSRQTIIEMGRKANARYVIIPFIASFSFAARVKWSNQYKIQSVAYVCDAQTGQAIATVVRKYSATPWRGDAAMWFTDYCDQRIVPDFCDKLGADLLKKIPQ